MERYRDKEIIRKADPNEQENINQKELKIAKKLNIENRMEVCTKSEAIITIKSHKPNFKNNPTFKLIDKNKTNLGRVAKDILQEINTKIRDITMLKQWQSTSDVVKWFQNSFNPKKRQSFIQFDVVSFYPLIDKVLMMKSLEWAKTIININNENTEYILQACKHLLYCKGESWEKNKNENFDVAVGSFHGGEACELVGLMLLNELSELGLNLGIYRDDRLGILEITPRECDKKKKTCY